MTYELTTGFTYLLRPNLILDGYVALEHDATSVEPFQTGLNLGQTLGIPGTNGPQRYQTGWPLFTIGSCSTYAPLGDWFSQTGGSPYYRYDHQHQYIANLDWLKGKHDIRFGTEIDQQYLNNLQSGPPREPSPSAAGRRSSAEGLRETSSTTMRASCWAWSPPRQ